MMVWIVEGGTEWESNVEAVFTDEEVAKLYKDKFDHEFLYSMETDPLADKLRAGYSSYGMHISRDGKMLRFWDKCGPEPKCMLVGPGAYGKVKVLLVCTMARDEQHALEIGLEKWREMLASGEWTEE